MARFLVLSATLLGLSSYASDKASVQFQTLCTACHTIGAGKRVGPDLANVSQRRTKEWLVKWITKPDVMLAEKDPTAMELFATYQTPMPNQQVTEEQAVALIEYIDSQSQGKAAPEKPALALAPITTAMGEHQKLALIVFLGFAALIALVFMWISRSASESGQPNVESANKFRKLIFWVSLPAIGLLLAMTLQKTPYPTAGTPDRVVYVATRQFQFIFSNEPITKVEDLERVPTIQVDDLPLNGLIEFRVTSLDVTHNFAVYDENGAVKAQVQSMPGYVNRLRTRFERAGTYPVLCLEYCGLAHHSMRALIAVK